MKLHSGSLYWPETFHREKLYPPLNEAKEKKAVIIGGGVAGTLCGYVLAKSGIPAILIEQNTIGSGSTLANTGLLQYSNDTPLSNFVETLGEQAAVSFYRACKQATEHLCQLVTNLSRDVHFKRRSSLYYASHWDDVPALRKEYDCLRKHNFDAAWWDEDQIAAHFPFRKAAAIVTQGDAEVNPLLLTQALAEDAMQAGLDIHEHTAMLSIEASESGYCVRTTGGEIQAEHIVYAVGYAPEQTPGQWVKGKLNRTYSLVTDPLPSLADWHERFLIWESARPYLYMRTTTDHRVIIGGLDERIREPVHSQQELQRHSKQLLAELNKLFPKLPAQIRYEWCATFGDLWMVSLGLARILIALVNIIAWVTAAMALSTACSELSLSVTVYWGLRILLQSLFVLIVWFPSLLLVISQNEEGVVPKVINFWEAPLLFLSIMVFCEYVSPSGCCWNREI